MFQLISNGGGSDWCEKTAREVVAAYLNASWGNLRLRDDGDRDHAVDRDR